MNLYREAFLHIKSFPPAFWIVIAATFINQAGNMALVFLVLYATQYLGLTLIQGTTLFATTGISMLLCGLLSGNLIDQIGAARVMIGAVCANGLTLLLFPFIHHYHALLLVCLVWGFCYGIYRPASQTFIANLSTPGLHKITFSLYRLVLNLGMSIGPAVGGYLAAHSFIAIFIVNGVTNILACLTLIIGLLGSIWMTSRPASENKKVFTLKWLKSDSALRLFTLGMIPVSMVFFQHESTLPIYLKQDLQLPLHFYGWLFTINTLMIVFFELLLNIATMHWSYRTNFILGTLLITAGFGGMYFAATGYHIILLTLIWTIGEMILYPSASSYIADIAPAEHRGSYMSIFSACLNLGILLGPWTGAIVMQHLGSHALWVTCGIWGMVSVAIMSLLKGPKK